ncbi:MAG: hypothetical protein S4CHLAM6_10930 [Chlamydiae bacterium]|nr:hypothetical protein [Chlamydiota bacterium]
MNQTELYKLLKIHLVTTHKIALDIFKLHRNVVILVQNFR